MRQTSEFVCEHTLEAVSADMLIMGIPGVTLAGFTNNNTLLVGSERKMMEVSHRVVIVADSSKFGRPAMVHLAMLRDAHVVVSDTGLREDFRDMLEANRVEVMLA